MEAKHLSGKQYLEIIDETIRLDIPLLMVGSSSIGKSYSLTAMATAYGMHGEFLFIGSEKSEYIEGIPNLRASNAAKESKKLAKSEQKSGVESSDEYKFTYLKPFWFPSYLEIRERLSKGRLAFKKNNPKLSKNLDDYDVLTTYKSTLNQTEVSMKTNADELYYISMLQGYGNYWLMLDEIDKVEEHDKDKFAPMLHIVRERQLKGWSMKGIDKYNEIKYVPSIKERKARVDFAIEGMDKNGKPVPKGVDNLTDVRIIAIANASSKITEGALVRRFVHFQVDQTLFTKSPQERQGDWSDEDEEMERKFQFHSCLVVSKVEGSKETLGDQMAALDDDDLSLKLGELNLQWSLGFIPDFMFPMYMKDAKPSDFVRNLFVDNINSKTDKTKTESYMKKILTDNFTGGKRDGLWYTINTCIVEQFMGKEVTIDKIKDTAVRLLSPINANAYNTDITDKMVPILDEYRKAGVALSAKLGKKYHAQETDAKGSGSTFLATESEYSAIETWIKIGSKCVELSMREGEGDTELTAHLIVALPLIQKQVVAASPYILQLYENGEAFGFLKTQQSLMGKTLIGQPLTELVPQDIKNFGKEYAAGLTNQSSNHDISIWINKYGYNLPGNLDKELDAWWELEEMGKGMSKEAGVIVKRLYKATELDIQKLTCPVLIPPLLSEQAMDHPDEAGKYLEGTADYLLIMKEIYGNLLDIISYYVGKEDYDSLVWYIEKFPYRIHTFHKESTLGPKLFGNLYDQVGQQLKNKHEGVAFDKILNT